MLGDFLQKALKAAEEDRLRQEQDRLRREQAEAPAAVARLKRGQEDNRQRWAGSRQSPGSYEPQWMGQNIVIIGTVSRVEVDPRGSPRWVTIYFKESPDATFVVCSPYPDMFQERVGPNLSVLIGMTLEAAGQVGPPYCGNKVPKGSIRVVELGQWQVHR
jgi:hypothetical protein